MRAALGPGSALASRRVPIRRAGLHGVLLITCILWIYPFVWMVSSAFKTQGEIFLEPLRLIPKALNFENFTRAWRVGHFGDYTINTAMFSVAVVIIVVAVSSGAGYALGRGQMPGKSYVVGALVVTMFLPKGYTIIPVFVLIESLGLNNSLAGVVLAQAGPAHVIPILLFMGYFASLPNELEEAAIIDGANQFQIYWRVMLPLTKPVVGTVALFSFINAWNEFLIPLVFTLSRPDLRTLGVGIYHFVGSDTTDWPGLAAAACISIIPVVVVFVCFQRLFIDGIAGAVKG